MTWRDRPKIGGRQTQPLVPRNPALGNSVGACMAHLRQDLTYALRTFARAPAFSGLAVLVIALGVGANVSTFTIANELLFRPLSDRADELVGIYSRDPTTPDSYRLFSYPNYVDIRDTPDTFAAVAAHTFAMVAFDGATDALKPRALASVVSANYFDTVGVTLAAGRPFALEEERPGSRVPVVIASYARWRRAGRDPAFVGSRLRINADEYTVIGIAPEGFTGAIAFLSPDVYLPLGMFDAVVNDRFKNNGRGLDDRANVGLNVVARRNPDRDLAFVSARLVTLSTQMEAAHPAENKDQALSAQPLSRFSAGERPQSNTGLATVAGLLLALSGLVLVVACLNIANMLLARGAARRKELAVRLALGAGRARLVRQLLTESLLLGLAGSALALLVSQWATSALAASLSAALPFNLSWRLTPDPAVLAATIALAGLATVAFGLGPALRLSRRDVVSDLKDRGSDGAVSGRLLSTRNLLVVGQVALSLALLTAGGIFARTTVSAAARLPGFSYDRLLFASFDTTLAGMDAARGQAAYVELVERTRQIPGVTSATLASTVPFGNAVEGGRYLRVGASGQPAIPTRVSRVVGSDYFKTLGIEMVRGREFTILEARSAAAPPVAMVDAAFARQMFGDVDPIGQMIRVAGAPGDAAASLGVPMEIVGLAPPLTVELLDRRPMPHVYLPFGRHYRASMHAHVRLATGVDPRMAIEAVRREARLVDPRLPVLDLSTFRAFHDSGFELQALRGSAVVFTGLGALALVLSVVGVYGLRSYLVGQRTREIGIRMALGASSGDVMHLILADGLRLTALGIAVGLPLAVLVSLALRSVFVDVGGVDVVVLSIATATLAVAALAAGAIPARRASKVQPLTALRTE